MKITPRKNLGQNFLRNQKILKKIIGAANLKSDDFVIEIGAGEGILTEELVKYAKKVVTIEIDRNLTLKLDSRFHGNDKIKIINDDVLKINLPELIKKNDFLNYKVVANIPYYITSPIIQLFLETRYPPREMILMVQKEVAQRICASPREIPTKGRYAKRISQGKPGNMSVLAVSVQYYAKPELLFHVPKESFWPVPEVDSAVIRITHNLKHIIEEERKRFFRIVKAGFSAKRKTLLNNLSNSLHLPKKTVEEKLKKAGIDPRLRAQELSIVDWKRISNKFNLNSLY